MFDDVENRLVFLTANHEHPVPRMKLWLLVPSVVLLHTSEL